MLPELVQHRTHDLEPRFHRQHDGCVLTEWVAFGVRHFHDRRRESAP